jgi:hypothetical protein
MAIIVAVPIAAVAAFVEALITRPPRKDWAHLHSFESAFANHFYPPALAILLGLWVGIAFTRSGFSPWLAMLLAGLTVFLVQFVVALAMLVTA